MRHAPTLLTAVWVLFSALAQALAVTIDTVYVGDAGNPADTAVMIIDHTTGYGSVPYNYRIGTYEVTNAQYVEFLNAKARTGSYYLYNTSMATSTGGGILRNGSGPYNYTIKPNMGDKPVTFVNWFDALRFANWMHNGQGNGDTETGAYTFGPIFPNGNPTSYVAITRNPGAIWFLPTENEWYKAAYYQPAAEGGDFDDYWSYATASNSFPTLATVDVDGDIANPGANVANYGHSNQASHPTGYLATVGSAGPLSVSYYGTFDQAGNLEEFTETTTVPVGSYSPITRGGSWDDPIGGPYYQLSSAYRGLGLEGPSWGFQGFRLATVPEPSSLGLAIAALAVLVTCAQRRRMR